MKRTTIALLFVLVGTTACGDDQQPEEGRALYDRIMSESYQDFQTAPGYDMPKASNAPHSDNTQIFVNDLVAQALEAGEPITEWPVGSLIVKDGYSGGELDIIAAMDKREDGWFWAEWLDAGSPDTDYSGKPDICIDCHEPGDDFVLGFDFPSGG
jgi:hypothetical protein